MSTSAKFKVNQTENVKSNQQGEAVETRGGFNRLKPPWSILPKWSILVNTGRLDICSDHLEILLVRCILRDSDAI